MPAFCKAKRLVLGVGNVLFGDDGFGPEVVEYLTSHYIIPDDIYVMDVGTGARKLLFTLALSPHRLEEIIIVDAINGQDGDGRVGVVRLEDLPDNKRDDFSLHQVPTSNMLLELQNLHQVNIKVIACDVGHIPQMIRPGLSTDTQKAVFEAAAMIATQLNLQAKDDI